MERGICPIAVFYSAVNVLSLTFKNVIVNNVPILPDFESNDVIGHSQWVVSYRWSMDTNHG